MLLLPNLFLFFVNIEGSVYSAEEIFWVYLENKGNSEIMQGFARGALWGILPSILFFLVALFCFKREFSLVTVLVSGFTAWLAAATVHQWILK